MSLYKQLWLAILFLVSLTFIGSFIVSSMSAKEYLEEQLSLKNIDNANSLALAIANATTDDVTTQLMISAQFDTGHYQYIRLSDSQGNIITESIDDNIIESTPSWFRVIFKINAFEGIAQIQRGWKQVGTLVLKSHDNFAYQSLWNSSKRLFSYCIGIALLSGIIGTILLKIILQPLSATVDQADAISKRQFIVVDEPKTREFKDLVHSMNAMSFNVKSMMEEESARLSRLQKGELFDSITNLPNREHFFNILSAYLDSESNYTLGILVIVRLKNLAELNREHGRQLMDLLLSRIGSVLLEKTHQEEGWKVGRLNGSDFALIAAGEQEPDIIARTVQEIILTIVNETAVDTDIDTPTAASVYYPGENVSLLLGKIDSALASAEHKGRCAIETVDDKTQIKTNVSIQDWKQLIDEAFVNNNFSLVHFPVINNKNKLLHYECPARLTTSQGTIMNGGQFVPWINRFNLGLTLDEKIVDLVIDELEKSENHLCINLSSQALSDEKFLSNLTNKLNLKPELAKSLWMEVPEYSVYQNLPGFRKFCHMVKPLGCHIGMEHVGHQISQIGEIHDLGLDYIKIDASITRQVDTTPAHQVLLRGLCLIVHSVGLIAIAEGVNEEGQWKMLQELGVDGATGPFVTSLVTNVE